MKQPYKEGIIVAMVQTGNRLGEGKKLSPEETYASWCLSGLEKTKVLSDSSEAHFTVSSRSPPLNTDRLHCHIHSCH